MMKKFFVLLIVILTMFGCSSNENNEKVYLRIYDTNTTESKEDKEDEEDVSYDSNIDILTDDYGNIIQKTVFDSNTGYTYIYMFTYHKSSWSYAGECTSTKVVIINPEGEIFSSY